MRISWNFLFGVKILCLFIIFLPVQRITQKWAFLWSFNAFFLRSHRWREKSCWQTRKIKMSTRVKFIILRSLSVHFYTLLIIILICTKFSRFLSLEKKMSFLTFPGRILFVLTKLPARKKTITSLKALP